MKEARARGHYSRDEIKEHMKQYNEMMKMKASESRNSHLAQMKALRKKNKEMAEEIQRGGEGDEDSLVSGISPVARGKHRKHMEALEGVEYKVEDDARERRMKYKKLQEMISPKKKHKKSLQVTPGREEETGVGEGEERERVSPRAQLSPRTRRSLEQRQQEAGQVDVSATPIEAAAVESIDRLVAASSSVQEREEEETERRELPEPVVVAREEKIEVDPFSDLAKDAVLDIASADIPTYLAADWMQRLHCEEEDVTGMSRVSQR